MKRKFSKILGVGLALVLVLSFSLVTAVPVAAQEEPSNPECSFGTGGDGTAGWSPDAPKTGAYSVRLGVTEFVEGLMPDWGWVKVYTPPTLLSEFSKNPTFYVRGMIGPGAEPTPWWRHGPFLNILLDTNGDFTTVEETLGGDIVSLISGDYAPESFVEVESHYWGALVGDVLEVEAIDFAAAQTILATHPNTTYTVVGVQIYHGNTWFVSPNQVVSIDDVQVNELTYDLEAPAAVWVDDDGSNANPGTENSPFATIQKGVDMVAESGTVNVAAGTYSTATNGETFSITIDKDNITIVSEAGPEETIINAERAANAVEMSNVNGVTLEGFTVINGGQHPLDLRNTEGIVLANNIIDLSGYYQSQVYATNSNNLTFRDSTIENAEKANSAVNPQDSSNCRFVNNLFQNNINQGLSLTRCTNFDISNNTFRNGKWGMKLEGSGHTIEYNVIEDNVAGGIWSKGAPNCEAHYNNIVGNGIGVETSTPFDATKNWWGTTDGAEILAMVSGNVDFADWLAERVPMTLYVPAPYATIQDAIDDADPGDTINVAAGEYAGAIVDEAVKIIGAAGGTSVITSGVPYKVVDGVEKTNRYSAFRPEAAGAEIRNFTINCNFLEGFHLGVYAVEVDDLTVDSLTINSEGAVQGITNWGGSNWVITNNVITNTDISGGGGIGIFVGAKATQQCVGNLIQKNEVNATATAETYSTPGIILSLDTRYGGYDLLDGTEDISGNQILDNTITSNGADNTVGIEVGTILGDSGTDLDRTDPEGIAALMATAALHDNLVQGNTIDGADTGMYFYNVTGLTVSQNTIINSVSNGIYVEHGHNGVAVNYNNIYGNAFGFEHEDIPEVDYGSIDATKNWWGDETGPEHATLNPGAKGDAVSENVLFSPWLYKTQEDFIPGEPCFRGSVVLSNEATPVDTDSYAGGWNTFSTPILLDDEADTVSGLLILAADSGLVIERAQRFDPASPKEPWVELVMGNTAVSGAEDYQIKPGEGFFIQVRSKGSLPILCSTELSPPQSRELSLGWNLVGAPSYVSKAAEDAFSSLGATCTVVNSPGANPASWSYPPAFVGKVLLPGRAYWVAMSDAGTLMCSDSTPVADYLTWELNQ